MYKLISTVKLLLCQLNKYTLCYKCSAFLLLTSIVIAVDAYLFHFLSLHGLEARSYMFIVLHFMYYFTDIFERYRSTYLCRLDPWTRT